MAEVAAWQGHLEHSAGPDGYRLIVQREGKARAVIQPRNGHDLD